MTTDDLVTSARTFWARRAGLRIADWREGQTVLVDTEHFSVSVVSMGGTALAWCPAHLHPRLADVLPETAADLPTLAATFADVLDKPLGSAALPYLSLATFRLPPSRGDVSVERTPIAGYDAFLATSTPAEVEESGLPANSEQRCWVSRVDGEIAAVVAYEVWSDEVAHLLALTAPRHRGAGHGVRTAASACADLLAENELLLQWRVSEDNPASAAVARKLGFVTLGRQSTILLNQS